VSSEATEPLEELLGVGGRDVLDVGCGEGGLVRRLASAGARVVGLDPLAAALEHARRAGSGDPSERYVDGVAQALAFAAASFDVVIFFNSLHHVPVDSMDLALAEAARVLRPGGVLYVQEPLAQGSFFELMRPVEDETPVRAAAQDALTRAAADGRLDERSDHEAVIVTRLADFEAFRDRMIGVEPSRAAAIEEQESALRAAFERLGRPVADGYEFDQPFRARLFGV
jgi:ubiquinone/menaquinone biosynthesis C-methylase UbiE